MYKQIIYDKTRDTRIDQDLKIEVLDDCLNKTAGEQPSYLIELANSIKKQPGFTYVMVSAVGAGEFWGSNKNGDYFPESALRGTQDQSEVKPPAVSPKPRYKTFEDAKFFRHHKNKPTDPYYGGVEVAYWDDKMKKVILIVSVSEKDAPDIAEDIRGDRIIAVSMGCKVPWDICSICGNKASKRSEYCSHLLYQMNKILPDGRKVYAINWKPRFFDISYVKRPAWRGGWSIMKVASALGEPLSADLAEESNIKSHDKGMIKEDEYPIFKVIKSVSLKEPTIPKEILDELSKYPPQKIWGALVNKGIIPKPNEFSYLMMKDKSPELANALLGKDIVFNPEIGAVDTQFTDIEMTDIPDLFDPKFVSERTCFYPDLPERIARHVSRPMDKEADAITPILIALGIGALYKALRGKISLQLMGTAATGTRMAQDAYEMTRPKEFGTFFDNTKQASAKSILYPTAIGVFTAPYIYAAYARRKGKKNIVTDNPGKTGLAGLAGLATLGRLALK
ncbi:MAG: hypothetical protein SVK08_01825 [Halobacteriota archaeon]|nr:hypothetical protein [Halobacteriota archaeon]